MIDDIGCSWWLAELSLFYTRKSITSPKEHTHTCTYIYSLSNLFAMLWVHKFSKIAWVRGKSKFIFQSWCCWYHWKWAIKEGKEKINVEHFKFTQKKWERNNFRVSATTMTGNDGDNKKSSLPIDHYYQQQ